MAVNVPERLTSDTQFNDGIKTCFLIKDQKADHITCAWSTSGQGQAQDHLEC